MDGLLWIAAVSCLSIWPLKYSNVAAFAATISEPKLAKSIPVTSVTKECILALRQGLSSEISVSCMNHTIRRHTVSYELKSSHKDCIDSRKETLVLLATTRKKDCP
jgi:hypothetical protein